MIGIEIPNLVTLPVSQELSIFIYMVTRLPLAFEM